MRTEGAIVVGRGIELKCADELRRLVEQDLKNLDRDVLSNTGRGSPFASFGTMYCCVALTDRRNKGMRYETENSPRLLSAGGSRHFGNVGNRQACRRPPQA
jgi:hypothetical protein